MHVRQLAVEGAYVFTPTIHRDDRGWFVSPHQQGPFEDAVGGPLFSVAQTSFSESRRNVVRGVHYRLTPPGSAKYTCCVRGRALDIVVDLRLGSPTFGRWDSVIIDPQTFRSMYLPVGVGHAFVALEEGTVVSYLLSEPYRSSEELAVNVCDPALGLPLPEGYEALLSDRDRAAPTIAQMRAAGLLPDYQVCQEIEARARSAAGTAVDGGPVVR